MKKKMSTSKGHHMTCMQGVSIESEGSTQGQVGTLQSKEKWKERGNSCQEDYSKKKRREEMRIEENDLSTSQSQAKEKSENK